MQESDPILQAALTVKLGDFGQLRPSLLQQQIGLHQEQGIAPHLKKI